jgi:hypothetical protein
VLKKLTATGIVAAAAAGFMLLGGAANAERFSADHITHPSTAYHPGHHYGWPRWHRHHWHGWGRWHHRHHHRFQFHH